MTLFHFFPCSFGWYCHSICLSKLLKNYWKELFDEGLLSGFTSKRTKKERVKKEGEKKEGKPRDWWGGDSETTGFVFVSFFAHDGWRWSICSRNAEKKKNEMVGFLDPHKQQKSKRTKKTKRVRRIGDEWHGVGQFWNGCSDMVIYQCTYLLMVWSKADTFMIVGLFQRKPQNSFLLAWFEHFVWSMLFRSHFFAFHAVPLEEYMPLIWH